MGSGREEQNTPRLVAPSECSIGLSVHRPQRLGLNWVGHIILPLFAVQCDRGGWYGSGIEEAQMNLHE